MESKLYKHVYHILPDSYPCDIYNILPDSYLCDIYYILADHYSCDIYHTLLSFFQMKPMTLIVLMSLAILIQESERKYCIYLSQYYFHR